MQSAASKLGSKVGSNLGSKLLPINYRLIMERFESHECKHSSKQLRLDSLERYAMTEDYWNMIEASTRSNCGLWGLLTVRFNGFSSLNKYMFKPYNEIDAIRIASVTDLKNIIFVMDDLLEDGTLSHSKKNEWIKMWVHSWRYREKLVDWDKIDINNKHDKLALNLCDAAIDNTNEILKWSNEWYTNELTREFINWVEMDGMQMEWNNSDEYINAKGCQSGVVFGTQLIEYIYGVYLNDSMTNKMNNNNFLNDLKLCKDALCKIAGLANDLVSLPKEIYAGEPQNALYYLLREHDYVMDKALDKLIEMINQSTDEFYDYYYKCANAMNLQFNNSYDIFKQYKDNNYENLTFMINNAMMTGTTNNNNNNNNLTTDEIIGLCKVLYGLEHMLHGWYHFQNESSRYKAPHHVLTEFIDPNSKKLIRD